MNDYVIQHFLSVSLISDQSGKNMFFFSIFSKLFFSAALVHVEPADSDEEEVGDLFKIFLMESIKYFLMEYV